MSLIEGIGDEVTVLAVCLLVLAIVVVAWMSMHLDVTAHTSVVTIDRQRFGELFQRVRDIVVHAHFAVESDTGVPAHSSASAADHLASDSLLVSGAVADGVTDLMSQSLHDICVDDRQGSDGEQKSLHRSEAASSPDNAGSSLKCQSASMSKCSTNCSESALSFQHAATAAVTSDAPPNSIQVRLQFVDGRQRTVFANPDDTIGYFKRSHFASELASNLMVRFITGGQELKDETSTLRSHRITFSGAVLHCLVTPARAATPQADDRQNVGYQFDIGILMFPLFGTLLAALWYARVVYRGYFNGTSTFSLLAISFLYVVALLASLRGGGQADQRPHIE